MAEIEWTLSYWPKIKMFGRAHSTASTEVANPEKIDGDVNAVIDALVEDFQGKVLKTFDSTAPVAPLNKEVAGKGGSIDSHGLSAGAGMIFVNSGYGSFSQTPGNVLIALKPKS